MLLNGGELDGERILQTDTVESMIQNQIAEALMPFGTNPNNPMLDRGWGYGIAVVVNETMSAYGTNNGEFGWSGSLGTFSWADPVSGTSVVIMLQIQPSGAYNIASKFKAMVHQSMIDECVIISKALAMGIKTCMIEWSDSLDTAIRKSPSRDLITITQLLN